MRDLTHIVKLKCPVQNVNDSVIAHKGALLSKPGIIAISGTGSNIFGVTETGKHIRNYAVYPYAAIAARFLSYDSVYKIIAGETDQTDNDFVNIVLKYFGVIDLSSLTRLASEGFPNDRIQRNKLLGDLAPEVTYAALNGSNLASQVCNKAAADIVTGIRLVGACFESDFLSVALIGSVANSIFIKDRITQILSVNTNKSYFLIEPALPAVLGAVVMAMQFNNIILNEQTLNNLRKSAKIINISGVNTDDK